MSFSALMIAGVILVILGILLGVSAFIKTIKRDIQIFFFRKKLPDIEADAEKSRKSIGKAAFGLVIIGLLLTVSSYVAIHFIGNDSIFSENVEGAFSGDNQTKQRDEDEQKGKGFEVAETDTIVIGGKTIRFDGYSWEDNRIEDFDLYLETIEKTRVLSLQDDYAVSTVYHRVEELLNKYGIAYGYGTEKGKE